MTPRIDHIQKRLNRFGWSASDKKIITLDGGILWLISVKRNNQSFSVQGHTQKEAWVSAWDLAWQIQRTFEKRPMILPFCRSLAAYNRAG